MPDTNVVKEQFHDSIPPELADPDPDELEFHKRIWRRDKGICRLCGKPATERQLDVAHIISCSQDPSHKHDPENAILLCRQEHDEQHSGIIKIEGTSSDLRAFRAHPTESDTTGWAEFTPYTSHKETDGFQLIPVISDDLAFLRVKKEQIKQASDQELIEDYSHNSSVEIRSWLSRCADVDELASRRELKESYEEWKNLATLLGEKGTPQSLASLRDMGQVWRQIGSRLDEIGHIPYGLEKSYYLRAVHHGDAFKSIQWGEAAKLERPDLTIRQFEQAIRQGLPPPKDLNGNQLLKHCAGCVHYKRLANGSVTLSYELEGKIDDRGKKIRQEIAVNVVTNEAYCEQFSQIMRYCGDLRAKAEACEFYERKRTSSV